MHNNNININILSIIRDNTDIINKILHEQNLNAQNLKKMIEAYENLYNYTNDIKYKKHIGNLYYFYFNDKNKALENLSEYISKIHNDSSVLHLISNIYKSKKDNINYKKYLEMAINSSFLNINNSIPNSEDVILGLNIGVAAGLSMNDDVKYGVEVYKKILQYSPIPANIMTPYLDLELKKANQLFKDENWLEAMIKYKNIFNNSTLEEGDFIRLIDCLAELKETDLAMEYLKKYEETAEDKVRADYVIGDLLYFKFNKIPESIERFERYILSNQTDALVYNTLGHLYSTYYNDKFLDKQLNYFLKAHELNPNSKTFIRNIALIYSKMNDFKNADKYYSLMLKLNPSYNDYFDYGCFLIHNGDFKKGYKYFLNRFNKETKPALYPPMLPSDKLLKSKKEIANKTILVQCEQGYGDSIMYARFVKELSIIAKKVLFIVQNELVDLFNTSNLGAEILPLDTDFAQLDYDYHVPIMNLPYILGTKSNSIPHTNQYLTVDEKKVEHFACEFVTNKNKVKIGLSFEGNDVSRDLNRDIELEKFLPLMTKKNVDVYILQHEDPKKQIDKLPSKYNIINVGKDFTTFEDTASAIKNMDLIITTDNVILNLAGALGVKTIGIFNKFTEYRWFDIKGDDVRWYKSIKPYQAKNMDEWDDVINQIITDLQL